MIAIFLVHYLISRMLSFWLWVFDVALTRNHFLAGFHEILEGFVQYGPVPEKRGRGRYDRYKRRAMTVQTIIIENTIPPTRDSHIFIAHGYSYNEMVAGTLTLVPTKLVNQVKGTQSLAYMKRRLILSSIRKEESDETTEVCNYKMELPASSIKVSLKSARLTRRSFSTLSSLSQTLVLFPDYCNRRGLFTATIMAYSRERGLGKRSYRLRSASAQHQPGRRRQKYLLHIRSANRKRFLVARGKHQPGQADSRRSVPLDESDDDSEIDDVDEPNTKRFNLLVNGMNSAEGALKWKAKELTEMHEFWRQRQGRTRTRSQGT